MAIRILSLPVIALFVLTIGIVGLVLLRRGLRGRLIGNHLVCRKCDYDLFNLPDDQHACPECGSDLAAPKAVQTGHRRRRPGMIVAGAALLLLFALVVGGVGTGVARQVDWQRLKPVAWLTREARGGDVAAWTELTRRLKAGSLSGEQVSRLVDEALAWQKDLSRVWKPAPGDFVEAARSAKLVDDIKWGTYALQAPQFSLRWRDKVHPGVDWLPGQIVHGPARVGTSNRFSMRIEDPLESDDPLADPRRFGGGSSESTMSNSGGGSMSASLLLNKKAVATTQPGKRTTAVRFKAQVRENWQTVIAEWRPQLSADWELVGKDESTVELVPDDSPALRQQIEAALVVDKLEVRPQASASGDTYLSLNLKIAALPVPVSFDVFLRAPDDKEWKLSSISASGPTHYGAGGQLPAKANFNARQVDLIFRPSPQSAESSVNIARMWNGEVTIHNVPVTWPATQPAAK